MMTEPTPSDVLSATTPTTSTAVPSLTPCDATQIPAYIALEIRRLAHDLSNALEIVTQTSYLLSTAELKPPASDWVKMLENGVNRALDINIALRNHIKAHSPH
jgi:hypothetical protein